MFLWLVLSKSRVGEGEVGERGREGGEATFTEMIPL